MCGGGGGDGGAAEREAARQRKQNEAIARVNKLFGIYTQTPKPRREDFMRPRFGNRGVKFDEEGYQKALQAWEAENAMAMEASGNYADSRSALYDRIREDVRDYYMRDLNQQRDDTERTARFGLARRGVIGGSSELDVADRILEEYNRGVLNIGNRADQAALRARAADEKARLDLISRIRAGMQAGNAIASATNALENNLDDARASATAQSLGQVFSDYGYYLTERAKERGYRRGQGQGGTFYANPGSYYGRE